MYGNHRPEYCVAVLSVFQWQVHPCLGAHTNPCFASGGTCQQVGALRAQVAVAEPLCCLWAARFCPYSHSVCPSLSNDCVVHLQLFSRLP